MQSRVDARIDELVEPYRRKIELLATVPGVSEHAAESILAEIGADITQFPTAGHLASWAGVCPGNNESAGKTPPGRRGRVILGSKVFWDRHQSPHIEVKTATSVRATDG
ncbi:transposase [Rhodococcus sp. WS3]|uniref:transposase n=1 Tax=Rhodococcus sp. WS3 TaxID=2486271 RepID=UPI000B14C411